MTLFDSIILLASWGISKPYPLTAFFATLPVITMLLANCPTEIAKVTDLLCLPKPSITLLDITVPVVPSPKASTPILPMLLNILLDTTQLSRSSALIALPLCL